VTVAQLLAQLAALVAESDWLASAPVLCFVEHAAGGDDSPLKRVQSTVDEDGTPRVVLWPEELK
jgi:hypothetical protein